LDEITILPMLFLANFAFLGNSGGIKNMAASLNSKVVRNNKWYRIFVAEHN